MIEIAHVVPGSTAAGLGLEPGTALLSINGEEVNDVIDFRFHIADERVSLVLRQADKRAKTLTFDKDPDDDLGLEFPSFRIQQCRNHCIFCFVDQMPAGCRKSLYVKDDDFRASFLYGNYITLGALSDADWDRIFNQRLSPLYVSVHATDPELRSSLLRNKKAPDILSSLQRLAAGGIKIHTQIVLCPRINDGVYLERTIADLAELFPAVLSIAVVPVGLTTHRQGRFPLRAFTPHEARRVVEYIELAGKSLKRKFGTRLVFASDEFYIKGNVKIPFASFYEDFPQIENGVGMVADFIQSATRVRYPTDVSGTFSVVTGVSFSRTLTSMLKCFQYQGKPMIRQVTVKNRFFGPSVTVAGLLTGGDILHALHGKRLGDAVFIPSNALKEDEDVFLDNMTLVQLQDALKIPVLRVESMGALAGYVRRQRRKTV